MYSRTKRSARWMASGSLAKANAEPKAFIIESCLASWDAAPCAGSGERDLEVSLGLLDELWESERATTSSLEEVPTAGH
jgi:hypothetical protein